jgi:2-dehydropantoate 2-reductase
MTGGRPWTVAVLGPGGVGGLLAALLARRGHRVICLAGEQTAHVLRRDGIRVSSSLFGDFHVEVEAATALDEPVDACVVAVKETALAAALERVPPDVLGEGLVVPLLNGIEHPAVLRRRYRPDLVSPGSIRVESTRRAPGVIEHGSPFVEIDLASATTARNRLDELAAMLSDAGVATTVRDDEVAVLWAKMSFLAPFALLTTRYGLDLGGVLSQRRGELLALADETAAVGRACGAPVDADAILGRFEAFPPDMKSSMQRDAEAGRPLELDAIGGALLRAAQQHGVDVPVATRLVGHLAGR